MVTCSDWRDSAPAEVEPLIAAEADVWNERLGWDVAEAWSVIEPARRGGQLPGYLARCSDGRVGGWVSFLLHRDALQVLALVAHDQEATAALVQAVLTSSEARAAGSFIVCVRDNAPALRAALADYGFGVDTYRYLQAAPHAIAGRVTGIRPWRRDGDSMAALCARAYDGSLPVRAFAPNGTPDEWREYIAGLIKGPGCGRFAPTLSFVRPAPDERSLDAGVLTTTVSGTVAHIAQLAVDPLCRGQGWGRRLIEATAAAADAHGYDWLTLLVSASNGPAVRLYEDLAFEDRGAFVVAVRRGAVNERRRTTPRATVAAT
jgi:ribosomal protein S18 acetylase RimI-like enzyme